MPAIDLASVEPAPEELVEVGFFHSAQQGSDFGLVVLSLGHSYWLMPSEEGYRLFVERAVAGQVRPHLAAYSRESARWPPAPIADPWSGKSTDLVTPLLWSSTVLILYHLNPRWSDVGVLDAHAVFARGEIWRAFTALFLHANAEHVISNALNGILVFTAVVSTLGRLRGWLLVALSAFIGNLAIAWLRFPAEYRSLGASTAIFAGIGLLCGRAIRVVARSSHPHRWRAMFVPLAAGLTVLGMYGAGGIRVDVGAHVAGFLAGLAIGFAAALPLGRLQEP